MRRELRPANSGDGRDLCIGVIDRPAERTAVPLPTSLAALGTWGLKLKVAVPWRLPEIHWLYRH